MPLVSEEFIKSANLLSQAVPALLDKVEAGAAMPKEAAVNVRTQAEVVADTLITQGLVQGTEKSAAVEQLCDHKEALNVLNRTAQQVAAPSMGSAPQMVEKSASEESGMRESDRTLLTTLGFSV